MKTKLSNTHCCYDT